MADYQLTLIRAARKTIALSVNPDHRVVLKIPEQMSETEARQFLDGKKAWIDKQLRRIEEQRQAASRLARITPEELRILAGQALQVIPERVRYFARLLGVSYCRITIRNQRSKWGSCSKGGNLNFNCLLMLAPPEVLDAIVAHELCHLKEMNHSPRFYAEVLRVFPEYFRCAQWLKKEGVLLMNRMTGSL